ncbi:MAG: SDR family NAD(P)-dependent oxidoreductase [Thermoprotei archaeon]
MSMRLEGKNAIVTGCARGIGYSIARKFIEEGARVFGCDINEERISAANRSLDQNKNFLVVRCDVSKPDEVERFIAQACEFFGSDRIDVLVNNAGIAIFRRIEELTYDVWAKTIDVNLTGVFNMCKAVIPLMKKNRKGVIINMSSTNGILAEEGLAHYNASKAGIILLTKTLALELGKYGIRAVSVCPGFILTDIQKEGGLPDEMIQNYVKKIPLGRLGKPDDVASAFVFLASDEASFITGTELVVDGGQICQE